VDDRKYTEEIHKLRVQLSTQRWIYISIIVVLFLLNWIQFSHRGNIAAILVDGTPVAYVDERSTAEDVIQQALNEVKRRTGSEDARFSSPVSIAMLSKREAKTLDDRQGALAKVKRAVKIQVHAFVAQNTTTNRKLCALPSEAEVKKLKALAQTAAANGNLPPGAQPATDILPVKAWVPAEQAFKTAEDAYAYLASQPAASQPAIVQPGAATKPQAPAPAVSTTPAYKPTQPAATTAPAGPIIEYEVQKGDTAWDIARSHKLSLKELEALNPGVNLDLIKPGQRLKLPAKQN